MEERLGFGEMLENLLKIDDESWAAYAFSRELLKHRIEEDKKLEMTAKAIQCGKEYAKQVRCEFQNADLQTIARAYNLNLEFQNTLIIGDRILFACYTAPSRIQIMEEPINKAVELIEKEKPNLVNIFTRDAIIDIILGHEMFHFIENEESDHIYTRNEKILLWKFMGYKNYSAVHALGEIGAMAFTKELTGIPYSPFILDFILYYSYSASNAEKIYRDILGKSLERCIHTVENY